MLSPKLMAALGHAGIHAWQLMHSSVIKIAISSPFCLPARPVSQGFLNDVKSDIIESVVTQPGSTSSRLSAAMLVTTTMRKNTCARAISSMRMASVGDALLVEYLVCEWLPKSRRP